MSTWPRALTAAIVAGCCIAVPADAGAAQARDAGRAASSLRSAFPELIKAPVAPTLAAGATVTQYVGSDVARVVDARGHRDVVLSSVPLRSRVGGAGMRPLSLSLLTLGSGDVAPANPLVPVMIATDAREGFTLGPDAGHLVTIAPLGIRADVADATTLAGQLLFAGAHVASDLLIRPAIDGVQTFEQLASADAPESFSYRLELTADQTADLVDGSVIIRQDGETIVQSLPPVALDAGRHDVPITISLAGDVVRLDVPHRDHGFSYPIAVDPDWISSYDYQDQPGLGREGWHASGQVPESPPAYYNAFINNVWDPVADPDRKALGFFIKPITSPAGRTFPIGVGATLFLNAPGTTHIRSVTYDDVVRLNDRDRQTLRLGLYGEGFGEADDVFEAEELSEDPVTLPSVPFPEDQDTPAKSAVMWMFTSPCEPATDRNCPPVLDNGSRTLMRVGSVQLVLTDFDYPSTQAVGSLRDLEDRWTNSTDSRTLDPSATDEGSGVRQLSVTVQDTGGTHAVRSIQSPCHPDHDQATPPQDNAICPRTLGLDQPLSLDTGQLPDGRSTFTVDAADLADNIATVGGAPTSFSVYLDRHAPTTAAGGPLHDAAGTWLRPTRPGTVSVTGSDIIGGQGNTSGIAHNHLSAIDSSGATVYDRDADTCTPPGPIATPCDPGKASTFTVDPRTLPEGPITFSATSTDLATNASEPDTWTVRLDRTAPAARATGDLLGLTSQHTSSTTPTSVTLHGRDAASGVARLQLVASNSDGDKLLADVDACGTGELDPSDGSCPHTPSVDVMVDPADLPDGPTTFIARAVDKAGIRSVDNQDWDTYVDHTPPEAPNSVDITQTSNTSVQVSWPTVVDQPLGSGDVSYEYLVTAGGQPIGGWQPTNNPYSQVGGLPPGVTIEVLVRAIDSARLKSQPASGKRTLRGGVRVPAPNTCNFHIVDIDSAVLRMNRESARPATREVTARTQLDCNQAGAIGLTFGEVCLQWELAPGNKKFRQYSDVKACSGRIASLAGADRSFRISARCQPSSSSATGRNRHRLVGYQGGETVNGTPAVRLEFQSPPDEYKRGRCPTRANRDRNEEELWDVLSKTNPARRSVTLASAPSTILRRVLGAPPNAIPGAWDAHHIIATNRSTARPAQRIAARCALHPNSALNGIYLRSAAASTRRPHFSRDFDRFERLRSYHPDTFYNDYTDYVNDAMRGATERWGDCLAGDRSVFDRLFAVSAALRDGRLFTGRIGGLHAATG